MRTTDDPDVHDNTERHRYEISVDGAVAGFAQYRTAGQTLLLTHTEVDDAYEGQGVGGRLVKAALDDARTRSLQVVPSCPFVAGYIQHHQEYADLVASQRG